MTDFHKNSSTPHGSHAPQSLRADVAKASETSTPTTHSELQDIITIEGYIQSTYMAVYPDKLLLLDAGCVCDVETILATIISLGRKLSDLKTVMVTHMHPDHAGGADKLRQTTGCTVATMVKDTPWYGGVAGRIDHISDLWLTYFVAKRQGKDKKWVWYDPILKPDVAVSDGDSIPHFPDWQVLETAGHTDRDLSLWHEKSGQVYTSDLILDIKGKLLPPVLVNYPDQYQASLQKIKSLEPQTVLLAHGEKKHITPTQFDDIMAHTPIKPRSVYRSLGKGVKNRLVRRVKRQLKRVRTP